MSDLLLEHEVAVRLGAFFGVFTLVAGAEIVSARRQLRIAKARRWAANIGIVFLNSVVVRLLFPSAATGLALTASHEGWGLLNRIGVPDWVAFAMAVALLDLAIYLQLVLFHAVPALWRLHMVHHADLDFDVTTGARFHPIEIALSMVFKLGIIAALGPPAAAVVVFEVLLNGTAMFNHGNIGLPLGVDRWLRWFVVTPDMHRVHHSITPNEYNRNFGFCLPCWDRMLGTYRQQPHVGHEKMTIGVAHLQSNQPQGFLRLLLLPFEKHTASE